MCINSGKHTECCVYDTFQLMEVGDLGHHGTPALLPVVEESRTANVSALILPPNMEERIVLVMAL